ncbi:MAG TPA: biopolymer transporter ExbD [Planctomycetaceae bacterium]|jgi:biopolymer transport protein ExbD|nr:biopolymer transporter ExbD [Planctomycetaceae bacterium]HAA49901.1 biopolymer transporter ExbD [Planctomycetaceae bacterium]HCK52512.1 biopolymer transporter ExbD [Planctomycetaceae bacterium]
MPLKGADRTEESAINLTPMIDIVFLLIIFFLVGARFTEQERQYDIQLPSSSEIQPLTGTPDALVINVRQNGTILLGIKPMSLDELETELRDAKENFEDQAVVVRGEGQGLYQPIVNVLGVCHRTQITKISLAYKLDEGGN